MGSFSLFWTKAFGSWTFGLLRISFKYVVFSPVYFGAFPPTACLSGRLNFYNDAVPFFGLQVTLVFPNFDNLSIIGPCLLCIGNTTIKFPFLR